MDIKEKQRAVVDYLTEAYGETYKTGDMEMRIKCQRAVVAFEAPVDLEIFKEEVIDEIY